MSWKRGDDRNSGEEDFDENDIDIDEEERLLEDREDANTEISYGLTDDQLLEDVEPTLDYDEGDLQVEQHEGSIQYDLNPVEYEAEDQYEQYEEQGSQVTQAAPESSQTEAHQEAMEELLQEGDDSASPPAADPIIETTVNEAEYDEFREEEANQSNKPQGQVAQPSHQVPAGYNTSVQSSGDHKSKVDIRRRLSSPVRQTNFSQRPPPNQRSLPQFFPTPRLKSSRPRMPPTVTFQQSISQQGVMMNGHGILVQSVGQYGNAMVGSGEHRVMRQVHGMNINPGLAISSPNRQPIRQMAMGFQHSQTFTPRYNHSNQLMFQQPNMLPHQQPQRIAINQQQHQQQQQQQHPRPQQSQQRPPVQSQQQWNAPHRPRFNNANNATFQRPALPRPTVSDRKSWPEVDKFQARPQTKKPLLDIPQRPLLPNPPSDGYQTRPITKTNKPSPTKILPKKILSFTNQQQDSGKKGLEKKSRQPPPRNRRPSGESPKIVLDYNHGTNRSKQDNQPNQRRDLPNPGAVASSSSTTTIGDLFPEAPTNSSTKRMSVDSDENVPAKISRPSIKPSTSLNEMEEYERILKIKQAKIAAQREEIRLRKQQQREQAAREAREKLGSQPPSNTTHQLNQAASKPTNTRIKPPISPASANSISTAPTSIRTAPTSTSNSSLKSSSPSLTSLVRNNPKFPPPGTPRPEAAAHRISGPSNLRPQLNSPGYPPRQPAPAKQNQPRMRRPGSSNNHTTMSGKIPTAHHNHVSEAGVSQNTEPQQPIFNNSSFPVNNGQQNQMQYFQQQPINQANRFSNQQTQFVNQESQPSIQTQYLQMPVNQQQHMMPPPQQQQQQQQQQFIVQQEPMMAQSMLSNSNQAGPDQSMSVTRIIGVPENQPSQRPIYVMQQSQPDIQAQQGFQQQQQFVEYQPIGAHRVGGHQMEQQRIQYVPVSNPQMAGGVWQGQTPTSQGYGDQYAQFFQGQTYNEEPQPQAVVHLNPERLRGVDKVDDDEPQIISSSRRVRQTITKPHVMDTLIMESDRKVAAVSRSSHSTISTALHRTSNSQSGIVSSRRIVVPSRRSPDLVTTPERYTSTCKTEPAARAARPRSRSASVPPPPSDATAAPRRNRESSDRASTTVDSNRLSNRASTTVDRNRLSNRASTTVDSNRLSNRASTTIDSNRLSNRAITSGDSDHLPTTARSSSTTVALYEPPGLSVRRHTACKINGLPETMLLARIRKMAEQVGSIATIGRLKVAPATIVINFKQADEAARFLNMCNGQLIDDYEMKIGYISHKKKS